MKIFDNVKAKWKFIKYYKESLVENRINILCIVFLEILISLCSLISPVFLQIMTDDVILESRTELLGIVCGGMLGIYVLHTVFVFGDKSLCFNTIAGIITKIRKQLLRILMKMDQAKLDTYQKGDIEHIFNIDISVLEKFFQSHLLDYFTTLIFIVGTFIAMLNINWKLLFLSCIFVPIPYIVSSLLGKLNYQRVEKRRVLYGEYQHYMYNSLGAWKEIKVQNLQKNNLRKFLRYRHKIAEYDIRSGYLEYASQMISFVSEIFSTKLVLYFVGGIFVMNHSITIGMLLAFIKYYEYFYSKISLINQYNYEFSNDLSSLQRIQEMLDSEIYKEFELQEEKMFPENGRILLEKISFRYGDTGENVLKNITTQIKIGKKYAIVGKNGSGKSTLIHLLAGIYKPSEGQIKIEQSDMKRINYSKHIGAVLQKFHLFDMSIADNLRLFRRSADDEMIIEACKKVQLLETVNKLPQGINSRIGENGGFLSGGQKQRLAIARLFLRMPEIWILDEASSAQDVLSEEIILNMIDKYCKTQTVIFITHRLESAKRADSIIVLNDGEIVGMGSHQELIAKNEYYQALFL